MPDPEKKISPEEKGVFSIKYAEEEDVLGIPPRWLMKWGISIIGFVFSIFFMLSFVIKYPDIIRAPIVITSQKPPIQLVAKSSGIIEQILVKDNTPVKKGEIIALVKTPLYYPHLQTLRDFIAAFENVEEQKGYEKLWIPKNLELGQLQTSYSTLIQNYEEFQHFSQRQITGVKVESLKQQIQQITRLNKSIEKQETLYEKDFALKKKNFERFQGLNQEGLISDIEKEEKQSILFQEEQKLENLRSTRINNDLRIEQLSAEIKFLDSDRQLGGSTRLLKIQQLVEQLKGEMAQWEEINIIKASINGVLAYSNIWSDQQDIEIGENLFTILPGKNQGAIIARCFLPTQRSGKVAVHAKVNIQIDAFPSQEFGVLVSEITAISKIPSPVGQNQFGQTQFAYIVEIPLSDSLVTTYGKQIPFRQEMKGTAQIITEERKIIERIFDKVFNAIKN